MIHTIDELLATEVERFSLAFTCERCAQFEPDSEQCSLGYPNDDHRARGLVVGAQLVFCKEFELA